jgi:membrane protease YdiL (CAAX protease family)
MPLSRDASQQSFKDVSGVCQAKREQEHDTLTGMNSTLRRSAQLGRVLLFLLACAVLLATVAPFDGRIPGLPTGMVTGLVTSLGTLILTLVFVRWDGLRLEDVGAAIGRRSLPRFIVGFLLGLLLVALHVSIEALAGGLTWERTNGVGFLDMVMMLIIYILLACREELAFHGYPLRRLNSLFGLWVSQLVVAVIFALEHIGGGSTLTQAVFGAGLGSLLFGMASLATRGLAVPIGLHAAWNLGDWLHGGKTSGGLWRPVGLDVNPDRVAHAAMIGYVVVMISATFAFWWWQRRRAITTDQPAG